MIRTKAQQKRAQEKLAKRLRRVHAERVDGSMRWRYRKMSA